MNQLRGVLLRAEIQVESIALGAKLKAL